MVNNRMTDGVGKKIVDALKKQTDVDIIQTQTQTQEPEKTEEPILLNETMPAFEFIQETPPQVHAYENLANEAPKQQPFTMNFNQPAEAPAPIHTTTPEAFINEFDDFELPANVEVLRQLITKIPSNVSKQTGAQIIKQTMEALGISMKGVLQEAQAVQENLNASARECQNNIAEYRRQINLLESQTQKLHRQYSQLNDIISLFIQAGN